MFQGRIEAMRHTWYPCSRLERQLRGSLFSLNPPTSIILGHLPDPRKSPVLTSSVLGYWKEVLCAPLWRALRRRCLSVGTCASPDCPLVDNVVDNQQATRPRDSLLELCANISSTVLLFVSVYSCVQFMSGALTVKRSSVSDPCSVS